MFTPHIGYCICHNKKRLIVVKDGYCKEGNEKRKGKTPKYLRRNNKPLAKHSRKRAAEERQYSKKRKQFLEKNSECAAKLKNCTHVSTEVHHKSGRIGKLLLDEKHWLPACHNCHTYIETHPVEATELNLSNLRLKTETT